MMNLFKKVIFGLVVAFYLFTVARVMASVEIVTTGDTLNLTVPPYNAGTEVVLDKRVGQDISPIFSFTLISPGEYTCDIRVSKSGTTAPSYDPIASDSVVISNSNSSTFVKTTEGPENHSCAGNWQTNLSTSVGYHLIFGELKRNGNIIPLGSNPVRLNADKAVVKVIDNTDAEYSLRLYTEANSAKIGTKVKLIGELVGYDTDNNLQSCYFYVSDQKSGYVLKKRQPLSDCSYEWDTSGSSAGLYTALLNIQGSSIQTPSHTTMPADTQAIRLCTTDECAKLADLTLVANPDAVLQGSIVALKGTVPNPNSEEYAGKQCFFFVGDGSGHMLYKGKSPLSTCQVNWVTSSTTVLGLHTVMVNIQEYNIGTPVTSTEPKAEDLVRVCEKDAVDCQRPNTGNPSDPSNPSAPGESNPGNGSTPGSGTNPGSNTGKWSSTISIPEIIKTADVKMKNLSEVLLVIALKWLPMAIGFLSFFGIVFAGFNMILAGGDMSKTVKTKNAIIFVIIGMLIGVLSYTIVLAVINLFNNALG